MFTKEQLLCIIAALKSQKCNDEIQAAIYADKLSFCSDPDKREWLSRVKGEYMREINTIEDTMKSAESAMQVLADKLNEEESKDEEIT